MESLLMIFCRVVVGSVFILSFIGKIASMNKFEDTVERFKILPKNVVRLSVVAFIIGELCVPICMILGGAFLGLGFLIGFFLLLIFSAALISVLYRHIDTSCHCFGTSEKLVSASDVWRNIGFLIPTGIGGVVSTFSSESEHLNNFGLVIGLVAGVIFVVILLNLSYIIEILTPE